MASDRILLHDAGRILCGDRACARLGRRRYEERVLSGREKFESRKEVMKAREERGKSANGSKSGEKDD